MDYVFRVDEPRQRDYIRDLPRVVLELDFWEGFQLEMTLVR